MTQVCVPMGEELAATWTAVVRQLLTTSSAEASEG